MLRLEGVRGLVEKAVDDEQRTLDAGHTMNGRSGAVSLSMLVGPPHHPFLIFTHYLQLLSPGGGQVAIAIFRHATGKAVFGIKRQGAKRQVTAVTGAENPNPVWINCTRGGEVIGGGQAITDVASSPVPMIKPFEAQAVACATAVVRREPGIALGDEVLDQGIPLERELACRASVGEDHRSAIRLGGRIQESRDRLAIQAFSTESVRGETCEFDP